MKQRGRRRENIYGPDKDFKHKSAFDPESWFNVTAHLLLKGTLWVKYEQDCMG